MVHLGVMGTLLMYGATAVVSAHSLAPGLWAETEPSGTRILMYTIEDALYADVDYRGRKSRCTVTVEDNLAQFRYHSVGMDCCFAALEKGRELFSLDVSDPAAVKVIPDSWKMPLSWAGDERPPPSELIADTSEDMEHRLSLYRPNPPLPEDPSQIVAEPIMRYRVRAYTNAASATTHSGPFEGSAVLGSIPQDTRVYISEWGREWHAIADDDSDEEAWVRAADVTLDDDHATLFAEVSACEDGQWYVLGHFPKDIEALLVATWRAEPLRGKTGEKTEIVPRFGEPSTYPATRLMFEEHVKELPERASFAIIGNTRRYEPIKLQWIPEPTIPRAQITAALPADHAQGEPVAVYKCALFNNDAYLIHLHHDAYENAKYNAWMLLYNNRAWFQFTEVGLGVFLFQVDGQVYAYHRWRASQKCASLMQIDKILMNSVETVHRNVDIAG